MIEMTALRLINWYGFNDETMPLGSFTLIAGRNGNGKSVLMDAMRYGILGDRIFNKATEQKGSRNLVSYTRGLLDATAKSYMRPADKYPVIHTHIVAEMYDKDQDAYFILGTVIETQASNQYTTERYIIEGKKINEIECTYRKDGREYIYSAGEMQKKYGFRLMPATEGLDKFSQRMGLRLNRDLRMELNRKLRSLMSYDPSEKIDAFIRERVLEKKEIKGDNTPLNKLISTKSNMNELSDQMNKVEAEIEELDTILRYFDNVQKAKDNLYADSVKQEYGKYLDIRGKLEELSGEIDISEKKLKRCEKERNEAESKREEIQKSYNEAVKALDDMDCERPIRNAEDALSAVEKKRDTAELKKRRLDEFQERTEDVLNWLDKKGMPEKDAGILKSLTDTQRDSAEKEHCVDSFRQHLKKICDDIQSTITRTKDQLKENRDRQEQCRKKIREYTDRMTTYSEIPDYVSLRDRINREFKKRGIDSAASLACESVLGLTDEAWRDSIEGYLGRRRYAVLVAPEHYPIAFNIFRSMKGTNAHLINTAILMKKNIKVEGDSVSGFIEVKNEVARRYFDYLLGRFHAVDSDDIVNYENAMTKDGMISVSLDNSHINRKYIKYYYLGQKTLELNRKKAEKELSVLTEEYRELNDKVSSEISDKSYLDTKLELFGEYDYDAYKEYNDALYEYEKRQQELSSLKEAQKNNTEYMELTERISGLKGELNDIDERYKQISREYTEVKTKIAYNKMKYTDNEEELKGADEKLKDMKAENAHIYEEAIKSYDRYISAGRTGTGGPNKDRGRLERSLKEAEDMLKTAQIDYNLKRRPNNQFPATTDSHSIYQDRRNIIKMDDLENIRNQLKEQRNMCDSIFKNEFALTILSECENARHELRKINAELSRLSFRSRYEFDVHYVNDGTEYEKIIKYAKYIKEKEAIGGGTNQIAMNTFTSYSAEEETELEKDIREIVDRIVSENRTEEIERLSDYRNYMNYEILISNDDVLNKAKLSRQAGYNSGAEVQIPYMLILLSALLIIYNDKKNSTRLVFIDEPFAKMDPTNIDIMMDFMKSQDLQMIFCAPDKTETLGKKCQVILPVLRTKPDLMQIGIIKFNKES